MKIFSCYWLFVWGIHQSPVDSPRKWVVMRSIDAYLFCCQFVLEQKGDLSMNWEPHDVHVTPLSMRWARVKSQSTPLLYLSQTKQNTIRKPLVMRPSLCNNATIIFCPLHLLIPTLDGPWGSLHAVPSQSVHSASRLTSLFRVIS